MAVHITPTPVLTGLYWVCLGYATLQLSVDTYFATFCNVCVGILEGIFSVGMLFLGWRTLSGVRKAVQKIAVAQGRPG